MTKSIKISLVTRDPCHIFSKSAAEAITMYYWIILSMFKRV